MVRAQFVERTTVRRCPGASGCQAAPMMSFRQRSYSSRSCSSTAAGCEAPRMQLCAVRKACRPQYPVVALDQPTLHLGTVSCTHCFDARTERPPIRSTTHATRRSTKLVITNKICRSQPGGFAPEKSFSAVYNHLPDDPVVQSSNPLTLGNYPLKSNSSMNKSSLM